MEWNQRRETGPGLPSFLALDSAPPTRASAGPPKILGTVGVRTLLQERQRYEGNADTCLSETVECDQGWRCVRDKVG